MVASGIVQSCWFSSLPSLPSVEERLEIAPIHKAQVISYMKLMDIPLGLLINFNEVRLVDGVSRLLLPGSNR
jgi:hypothetical protein